MLSHFKCCNRTENQKNLKMTLESRNGKVLDFAGSIVFLLLNHPYQARRLPGNELIYLLCCNSEVMV